MPERERATIKWDFDSVKSRKRETEKHKWESERVIHCQKEKWMAGKEDIRARDLARSSWTPYLEVDNEIICEIKPWLYLLIVNYVI